MRKLLFILIIHMVCLGTPQAEEYLRLATTTSTENTGLLSALHPPFEEQYRVKVHVISVGTGKALRLGQDGDVDVVLVHAPDAELEFVNAGYGMERQPVMHNDFILLGPAADPAGVKNAATPEEAMQKIYSAGHTFISRGDDSGTHQKELELWKHAGLEPGGDWYLAVGQGMGQVLQMADDKLAYTLSDRGTWLVGKNRLELEIVYQNAPGLDNPYHVIIVNPERHPHVKLDLARKYAEYLTGAQGQKIIREFGVDGEPLFFPDVIR